MKYYLLSFPRSGNTFMRYIIERIYRIKTFGLSEKTAGPLIQYIEPNFEYIEGIEVMKRHNITDETGGLIYLERPKKEVVKRYLLSYNYTDKKVNKIRSKREYSIPAIEAFNAWDNCRNDFLNWPGPKCAIDYQMIIKDISVINDILFRTFGFQETGLDEFILNMKDHIAKSLYIYTDLQNAESFSYGIKKSN